MLNTASLICKSRSVHYLPCAAKPNHPAPRLRHVTVFARARLDRYDNRRHFALALVKPPPRDASADQPPSEVLALANVEPLKAAASHKDVLDACACDCDLHAALHAEIAQLIVCKGISFKMARSTIAWLS